MLGKLVHWPNAQSPMFWRPYPDIVKLVNLVQLKNAKLPIVLTNLKIVTFVKLEQSMKADRPILVTLYGILRKVNPVQPLNAKSPIL
jgi:hypothetical protein